MKEIILTLLSLTILLSLRLPVASAQGKVYGDADIRKYKSSSDEASYEYNRQIREQRRGEESRDEEQRLKRRALEQERKDVEEKRSALDRIQKIEGEKSEAETRGKNKMKWSDFVDKSDKEREEAEKLKREGELDDAYRRAGLSRDRDMQKRTAEAERKAQDAERRARNAESRAATQQGTAPGVYFDPIVGSHMMNLGGVKKNMTTGTVCPSHAIDCR